MKSIKPGRGPSMMGGFGAVFGIVFGIFWTVLAASMTQGFGLVGVIFPLFGVLFIIIGVVNAVYNFKNATGKNRYSEFDITDDTEEPDPLNQHFGGQPKHTSDVPLTSGSFCPYCGAPVQNDFAFCRKCGKQLPKE